MSYTFAAQTCVVGHGGLTVTLREGDAWDASDPFVKAHPDLFSATPPNVRRFVDGNGMVVEQATAAPGEQRATRRANR